MLAERWSGLSTDVCLSPASVPLAGGLFASRASFCGGDPGGAADHGCRFDSDVVLKGSNPFLRLHRLTSFRDAAEVATSAAGKGPAPSAANWRDPRASARASAAQGGMRRVWTALGFFELAAALRVPCRGSLPRRLKKDDALLPARPRGQQFSSTTCCAMVSQRIGRNRRHPCGGP